MNIKLLVPSLLFSLTMFSQTSFWRKPVTTEMTPNKVAQRDNFPEKFEVYQLNLTLLLNALQDVPNRLSAGSSNVVISIPNADGLLERFQMFEFSNFSSALQAQYPLVRSYIGKGLDDQTAVLRMSSDPKGFQGIIFRGNNETEFFEPYSQDYKIYAFFKNTDRKKGLLPFECSTEDVQFNQALEKPNPTQNRSSSGELITFRLAVSVNAEYTAFFGGVAGAIAGINATLTRVNGVFEKDFGIHLSLIDNNNLLIFTNPATDPYTSIGAWNAQLQSTLTSIIGEENYDIGHMFGPNGSGGSAGCIGCVCVNGIKGSGKTGTSNGVPAGDTFDIDYVAHEIGHQLGGNHTFSHNIEGSGVNVEPGSGSTIMGYAGITSRDVQQNSDPYFVYASIKQVQDNMVAKTCPVRVILPNSTPIVNAGLDYTIPRSTPFVLAGTAIDPNGDEMTYVWEQNDSAVTGQTGASSAAIATKTGGPNFRSYNPTTSPLRYFPRIQSIIANQSTTAGQEINVEALSSVARTLNFVFTARDNFLGAGQTQSDNARITVSAGAGPFLVSSPNTAVSWAVGSNQTVSWDVAGTTANNVNTAFVDVFLSIDGGFTYPIQLASKVPNDGLDTITVPNNIGTTNRIMVKGYKHVFFDISNTNFSIVAPSSTFAVAFNGIAEQQNKEICIGSSVTFAIPYTVYDGFNGATSFSISGQPNNSTVTFSPSTISSNGTVLMTLNSTANSIAGFYSMVVTATSGSTAKTVSFYLNLFDADFGQMALNSPANLAIGQPLDLSLSWQSNPNATLYDVQVSTDPNFSSFFISETVSATSLSLNNLASVTQYYWRVLPKNSSCAGNFSPVNIFKTAAISCTDFVSNNVPIAIPTTANVTVNSTVQVAETNIISDVNITLSIAHTWVNDMIITLISPSGTQVWLVNRPCTNAALANMNATFNDGGSPIVCGNNPAIFGTVIPFESLSAFNGEPMNGTWTLRVLDVANQDGGAINSWSLNLCSSEAVELSTIDNSIQNFSVFPNPNKGDFTITFTSNSTNKINVDVFDIRGRKVYSKEYQNIGFFNENIQLRDFQSGIYLVKVQDGEKQITKKIIIE